MELKIQAIFSCERLKGGKYKIYQGIFGGTVIFWGTVLSFQREIGRKVGMCTVCALA